MSATALPPALTEVDASIADTDASYAPMTVAVRSDAGVVSGEIAWLVTHIADNPEPQHGGESDAVRRLATIGAEGVHAVAEVFRVGDPRRVPFARRVIERVALTRCHRDRTQAGITVVHLENGAGAILPPPDAGIIWWSGDTTQWPAEAVGRLHRWADAGMPCERGDAGM